MSRSTNNTYSPPRLRLYDDDPYGFNSWNFEDDFDEWDSEIPYSPLYDNFQATQITGTDSRLTLNEQKKALQKLKKEIYNPFRRTSWRVNLFYRDIVVNEKEMESDEDGKRCAICLEDFEPKEEIMLTPCKHMFHEECIVPWVKCNGRCPTCRFFISD